ARPSSRPPRRTARTDGDNRLRERGPLVGGRRLRAHPRPSGRRLLLLALLGRVDRKLPPSRVGGRVRGPAGLQAHSRRTRHRRRGRTPRRADAAERRRGTPADRAADAVRRARAAAANRYRAALGRDRRTRARRRGRRGRSLRGSGPLPVRRAVPTMARGSAREGGTVRLEGKVALVVGGGSGMGRAGAAAMAAEGAKVVVSDLSLERAEAVAAAMGGDAAALHVDVTSPELVERLVAETVERYGRLDVLYHC